MIALCTGAPAFDVTGDQAIVSFPSGAGEAVRVALNRNQLVYLSQLSQRAMVEAFQHPQPVVTDAVVLHRDGEAA